MTSGYTSCTCCGDDTVSADQARPELCSLCIDAGCSPAIPERLPSGRGFAIDQDCERVDGDDPAGDPAASLLAKLRTGLDIPEPLRQADQAPGS